MLLKSKKGMSVPEIIFTVILLAVATYILLNLATKGAFKPAQNITGEAISCSGFGNLWGKEGVCVSANTACDGTKMKIFQCSEADPARPYCCFGEIVSGGGSAGGAPDEKVNITRITVTPESVVVERTFYIECETNIKAEGCIKINASSVKAIPCEKETWTTSDKGKPVFNAECSIIGATGRIPVICKVDTEKCKAGTPSEKSITINVYPTDQN
ncbi:MAG: hypothetical protein KKF46_07115 [Nanoarchaeota archaeon]|nr:hypothetical protein [Nanoarchaeota archaeon]MBU1322098.1 hypothetical protein [Nanoarchaeota archaeon]MBU1597916.1 hypothetical protein [Nanoarchaeota archaeon]MBU2442058.1 hypothetical protein [Nanoarchaeota archaeon]